MPVAKLSKSKVGSTEAKRGRGRPAGGGVKHAANAVQAKKDAIRRPEDRIGTYIYRVLK